jgi:hypothetical protein
VPITVVGTGIPQPLQLVAVTWSLRTGTAPYWWPIVVKGSTLNQPVPRVFPYTVFQPPPPFTIGSLTAGAVGSANAVTAVGSGDEATDVMLAKLIVTDQRTGGPR